MICLMGIASGDGMLVIVERPAPMVGYVGVKFVHVDLVTVESVGRELVVGVVVPQKVG